MKSFIYPKSYRCVVANVEHKFFLPPARDVVLSDRKSPGRIPNRYIVEVDDCLPECCTFSTSTKQHFTWLKLRCSIRCLVEHKYTEWFILFIVMFSSFVLVGNEIYRDHRNISTYLNKQTNNMAQSAN